MGLISRPSLIAPQQAGQINWAHPLAKGLSFAWFAGTPDKEWTRGVAPSTRNATRSVGARGPAVHCSAGQVNIEWPIQFTTTSDGAGTGDFTMFSVGNPVASSSSVNHMLAQKNDAAGTPYAQAALLVNSSVAVVSSGSAELFCYNNGNNSAITVAGVVDGKWHAFAGVRSGTTHSIFVDGSLKNSATLTAQNISQANRYTAVGSRGNGTTESYVDDISCALMWNRALTAAEIQQISANPYLLLAPAPGIARYLNVPATGSIGAASGTGVATGVGASLAASASSAVGVGAATGVGAALKAAAGSAAGVGTTTGTGASNAASAGASAGTGSASGAGASQAQGVGSAAGTSTVSGVGASIAAGVGSASGTGTATGVGSSLAGGTGVGSASGTGTANGVGASIAGATGFASGVGSAVGIFYITANSWIQIPATTGFWHAEDFILTEDGGYFLLEDTSRVMLDTPPGDPWTKSASTAGVWH